MKVTKIPDLCDDEYIYGFQIITLGYAIDLYLSFDCLKKFHVWYEREDKCLVIKLSFINIQFTNLKIAQEWFS